MTTDIDNIIRRRDKLTRELNDLQNKAAVAKADEERIAKEVAEDLKVITEKYGCTTFDEAIAKRDEMLEELTSLCDDLEKTLASIQTEV